MDRPTCETCPYSILFDATGPTWLCQHAPSVYVGPPDDMTEDETPASLLHNWAQPLMANSATCGRHPAFPAYLVSLGFGPK